MENIAKRQGKGVNFKAEKDKKKDGDMESCANTDEEDEEPDDEKPFEPLRVWQSPHQGGIPQGLPSQL